MYSFAYCSMLWEKRHFFKVHTGIQVVNTRKCSKLCPKSLEPQNRTQNQSAESPLEDFDVQAKRI